MGPKVWGLDSLRFKERLKELTVCSTTERSLLIMWNYLQQRKTQEGKERVEESWKIAALLFFLRRVKSP